MLTEDQLEILRRDRDRKNLPTSERMVDMVGEYQPTMTTEDRDACLAEAKREAALKTIKAEWERLQLEKAAEAKRRATEIRNSSLQELFGGRHG